MPKPVESPLKPYWNTTDNASAIVWLGDVLVTAKRLKSKSVQCIVTSPPYWGLRSYLPSEDKNKLAELGSEKLHDCLGWAHGLNCAKCNWAGGCHVCRMQLVFRELRRVLRDDGTLWLNYGDSYMDKGQLAGVPWRVALALQADGWVLRQDIIWHKPAPMPESCRNRCTKAHEYVFLMTKTGSGYYCDMDAIKEQIKGEVGSSSRRPRDGVDTSGNQASEAGIPTLATTSNKRSVWTVASQGYPGAHFATFSPKLITPMILAGTSEYGCCGDCGAPWRRVTEEVPITRERPNAYVKRSGEDGTGNSCANDVAGVEVKTTGWQPTCECNGQQVKVKVKGYGAWNTHNDDDVIGQRKDPGMEMYGKDPGKVLEKTETRYVSDLPLEDHPVVPCTVFDPFLGSGTTIATALELGRHGQGTELSEQYLAYHAIPRIEAILLARPALSHLIPSEQRQTVELGANLLEEQP